MWKVHHERGERLLRLGGGGAASSSSPTLTLLPPPPQAAANCLPASVDDLYAERLHVEFDYPTVGDIDADIPRTFPFLSFFHDGGEWETKLRTLLASYCSYRPDAGYVQGMSFIGAMLLLNMDASPAFVCLANMLHPPRYFSGGYTPDISPRNLAAYTACFRSNLPLLCRHFEKHDVSHDMYLVDWRLSVFCRVLPLDVAVRVWDCFLREGEAFFIRCAIGLLKLFAPRLAAKTDLMGILKLLKSGAAVKTDELFESISHIGGAMPFGGGDNEEENAASRRSMCKQS
jgi:hypothetical protein